MTKPETIRDDALARRFELLIQDARDGIDRIDFGDAETSASARAYADECLNEALADFYVRLEQLRQRR